jgi:hypothetical protein
MVKPSESWPARNPEYRLVVRFGSHSLEVVEVVLRCRRSHDGNDGDVVPSPSVDVSFPSPLLLVVFDRNKALGPRFASLIVHDQKPYSMVSPKMLEGPVHLMHDHAHARLGRREKAVQLGIDNLDTLPEHVFIPSDSHGDDDCGNYAADDSYNEIHSFLAYRHSEEWSFLRAQPHNDRSGGEGSPRTSSRLRFLRIRRRSSFADRLLLGAVGHTLRYGLLDRALGHALLHGFPNRFFYFLCCLLFGLVIRHRGNPRTRPCLAIGNCTWAPFRCFPAVPLPCA